MEVTVHLTDVMAQYNSPPTDGRTTRTVTITPETTIADVGTMLKLNLASYSIEYERYYRVCDPNAQERKIPFVISDGLARWDVWVQDVSVADFFTTFGITSNELHIRYGWPTAGGLGAVDIPTLWNDVYTFLSYISPVLQAGGAAGAGLHGLRLLVNRLSQKASPGSVFSLVASRPRWTAADLAQTAGLTLDDAKGLLGMCGYEYDRHMQMYQETPESDERIAKLGQQKWTLAPGRPTPRS